MGRSIAISAQSCRCAESFSEAKARRKAAPRPSAGSLVRKYRLAQYDRNHVPLSRNNGSSRRLALYRLTLDRPPHDLQPRYNVWPTDPIDVVTDRDGERDLVRMRWGLVPWWWSKPLKELRMATFNARAETVETKPVFRDAFKRSRCLIPMSGYHELQNALSGKQPWYFTAADGSPLLTAAALSAGPASSIAAPSE
jgi:putative SOS response-associated peptidase YedK